MEFRIKESGEVKDLTIIDKNGIEWTGDLLGNNNALEYNKTTDEHVLSEEDFDWWKQYIKDFNADAEEAEELAEELGIEESEIWEEYNMMATNDLNDEHDIKQHIFKRLRSQH
jgi:hypothetical protein